MCSTLARLLFITVFLATINPASARTTESSYYAPKLSVLSRNGLLTNTGTSGGSSMAMGGLNAVFNYFMTPSLALGVGYNIDFDFTGSSVPLRGADLSARWYFSGPGTRVSVENAVSSSETHSGLAFFAGAAVGERSYFRGVKSLETTTSATGVNTAEPTGSFMEIAALLGFDRRINRRFELSAVGAMGLLTFASSDPRVRIRATLVNVGFSYIF